MSAFSRTKRASPGRARIEWAAAVARLEGCGYRAVASFNPYWDEKGKTFEDPDGYRVVFQNAHWPEVGPKKPA